MKENKAQDEYLFYIDIYVYYLEENCSEQAEKQSLQELQNIEQSLNAENVVILILKEKLFSLFFEKAWWEEAKKLQEQMLKMSMKTLKVEHSSTLISINNLASTYNN